MSTDEQHQEAYQANFNELKKMMFELSIKISSNHEELKKTMAVMETRVGKVEEKCSVIETKVEEIRKRVSNNETKI